MLIKPIITEKSTLNVNLKNCYTFLVNPHFNKIEIKNHLIDVYKIEIKSIRIINYIAKKKKKMLKKGKWGYGKTNRIKKAIIQVKSDKKIEFKLKIDEN